MDSFKDTSLLSDLKFSYMNKIDCKYILLLQLLYSYFSHFLDAFERSFRDRFAKHLRFVLKTCWI